MVRILDFHCHDPGSVPSQGTEILQASQHGQKKEKNEILSFATTWMGLEGIMLSEISQTEKEKYCMISLTQRI